VSNFLENPTSDAICHPNHFQNGPNNLHSKFSIMDHRIDEPENPSSSRSDTEMNSPTSEPEKLYNNDGKTEAAVEAGPLSESKIPEEDAVTNGMTAIERRESAPENYPHGLKLVVILLSIYCAVFLVALDRTIIATALPRITDDFHSFDDIGWVCLCLFSNFELCYVLITDDHSTMALSPSHNQHSCSSSAASIPSILPNASISRSFFFSKLARLFVARHQIPWHSSGDVQLLV